MGCYTLYSWIVIVMLEYWEVTYLRWIPTQSTWMISETQKRHITMCIYLYMQYASIYHIIYAYMSRLYIYMYIYTYYIHTYIYVGHILYLIVDYTIWYDTTWYWYLVTYVYEYDSIYIYTHIHRARPDGGRPCRKPFVHLSRNQSFQGPGVCWTSPLEHTISHRNIMF